MIMFMKIKLIKMVVAMMVSRVSPCKFDDFKTSL